MKNIKKYLFLFLLFSIVATIMISLTDKPTVPNSSIPKIQVTASFYPLYFFASQIGGGQINVVNITPAGAEPHDYEPTTNDLLQIEKSKLLILNGSGLEPWQNKISDILSSTKIVETSNNLALASDPHIWLDPVFAKEQASKILSALKSIDPSDSTYFEKNAKSLFEKFDDLDNSFTKGLQNCKQKTIVTSHAALGYLARRYSFSQISLAGLSPDSEPSAKQMANITKIVKEKSIQYVFFEELVSPRLAQTIADETGAKTLVFNPLEGLTNEEIKQGLDYFSVQKNNLDNLKIAMQCD